MGYANAWCKSSMWLRKKEPPGRRGCRMRDSDLRAALLRRLARRHSRDAETLILQELGLRHGAAHVDVAVVNGLLHGYELKSDSDSLGRLARQALVYGSVLDRVTLVVGRRHVEEAVGMVPAWWGVQVAEMGTKAEPSRCRVDASSLAPVGSSAPTRRIPGGGGVSGDSTSGPVGEARSARPRCA
jgi:hypothetical protein